MFLKLTVMQGFAQRTVALIGDESYQKLKNSNVLIVGLGGVGGFVAEFLARAGIESMTLVDGDEVEETNLNRQIIATCDTVGMAKTDALAKRLSNINFNIKLDCKKTRFNKNTIDEIFDKEYDFVIDAIDSVADKVLLVVTAKQKNIPVVCAMGAGNRFDIPSFEVKDIFKTENDGLAKVVRKKLRENQIKDVPCVCAKSNSHRVEGVIGSISYYPAACASVIAAYVVNKLI